MLKPLHNRIVVRPEQRENVTESGLYLSPEKVEKPETGVVLVGNDEIKEGDRVLFSKYGYDEFKEGAETLFIISTASVLAILT